ncbi:hypothetical protein ACOSQ2_007967 [Xanthoceras sorbifolium]
MNHFVASKAHAVVAKNWNLKNNWSNNKKEMELHAETSITPTKCVQHFAGQRQTKWVWYIALARACLTMGSCPTPNTTVGVSVASH